ncbi:hypothetical protein PAAG_12524 [Paracoccidioides lutzii Pb01]|uniref:Uncharacterized protein n=1 Tax=Paracoccidioides lutzii (strain ATCC MYA-826 / Pb01) TaxID=502779 RepID=A0A0A2UYZ8_PARBA|nr:hypothetical protein PAAG_12524 [Paracoccidioides lutzii Pb01]KGQ00796.1 hypothetical protein PAAG_12524 [Paracoccidioides lutzii Pb01]
MAMVGVVILRTGDLGYTAWSPFVPFRKFWTCTTQNRIKKRLFPVYQQPSGATISNQVHGPPVTSLSLPGHIAPSFPGMIVRSCHRVVRQAELYGLMKIEQLEHSARVPSGGTAAQGHRADKRKMRREK